MQLLLKKLTTMDPDYKEVYINLNSITSFVLLDGSKVWPGKEGHGMITLSSRHSYILDIESTNYLKELINQ